MERMRFTASRSRLTALILAMVLATVTLPASADADPALVGRWLAPFWEGGDLAYDPPSEEKSRMFPTAAHLVALPDGRLLYWNGVENLEDAAFSLSTDELTWAPDNSKARVLDLGDGKPRWTIPTPERGRTDEARDWQGGKGASKDIFCGEQKLLYDGTVLIAGGTEWRADGFGDPLGIDAYGDDEATIFDPAVDAFHPVDQMAHPRWYPAMATLPDGRVMIASGVRRLLQTWRNPEPSFSQVRETEIYDPRTSTWSSGGTDPWSLPLYPRLHVMPDGTVLYGGAGQAWGQMGTTADEALWALQRVYDPATQTWNVVGTSRYGARGGATSTLLRLQPPYKQAEVLVVGGTAIALSPGSYAATTISDVIRWENGRIVNEQTVKSPVAGLAGDGTQLRNRRWAGSSVMLPTGEVLLVNGGDLEDTFMPGTAAAVRTVELYDPATGTWRELAADPRDRVWHSTAVLLPDGRVLVGGHAPEPAFLLDYDNTATRANNFRDSTFEIFEPPYLHRGDRPVVESMSISEDRRALTIEASGIARARGKAALKAPKAAARANVEVVLVRLGATTHAHDNDQRAVVLEHTVNQDGTLTASLPSGSVVPPGPYYVFVNRLDRDGAVPSVAQTVLVQPGTTAGEVVFAG